MVRELVHHGYQVRACLRDAGSWRGEDAIAYLAKLPGVTIVDGCDLFVPGSFDAAFKVGVRLPQFCLAVQIVWPIAA
jgi:hypothetical protein